MRFTVVHSQVEPTFVLPCDDTDSVNLFEGTPGRYPSLLLVHIRSFMRYPRIFNAAHRWNWCELELESREAPIGGGLITRCQRVRIGRK